MGRLAPFIHFCIHSTFPEAVQVPGSAKSESGDPEVSQTGPCLEELLVWG